MVLPSPRVVLRSLLVCALVSFVVTPAWAGQSYLLETEPNGTTATAVVQNWREGLNEPLAQQLGAEIEVEQLTLEDIFLELHR